MKLAWLSNGLYREADANPCVGSGNTSCERVDQGTEEHVMFTSMDRFEKEKKEKKCGDVWIGSERRQQTRPLIGYKIDT